MGGLAAGLHYSDGDVYKGEYSLEAVSEVFTCSPYRLSATLYATVSASYIIEQEGLPMFTLHEDKSGEIVELWNGETPQSRLRKLMDTNVV